MKKRKVSQWFSIDHDGQPSIPGDYDVAYSWQYEDNEEYDRRYWSGTLWLDKKNGKRMSFGNENTKDERWRGLAEKP